MPVIFGRRERFNCIVTCSAVYLKQIVKLSARRHGVWLLLQLPNLKVSVCCCSYSHLPEADHAGFQSRAVPVGVRICVIQKNLAVSQKLNMGTVFYQTHFMKSFAAGLYRGRSQC